MKKPIATALLLAVTSLIGTASTARATSFVMVRDADLADQAAAVVEVRIEAVENARTTRPTTDYRVAVERLIAGTVAQRSLLVRVPGGTGPGGKRLAIWGAPQFTPGERALLFLARESDGSYRVLHLMLGAFHEVKSAGKSLAVRDLGEAIELPRSKGAIDPRERGPRDLSQFAQWIADRAAGRRREADYFASRSGISNVDQSFTLQQRGPRKLRWFDFDTGGAITWRADAAGQPGVAGGGLAEFQHALGQWTADSATPIRFLYGGTMAAGAGGGLDTFDGINEISFNRPLSDPFRCDTGGVLAVGGPWYDADVRTRWNGEDYIPILGADIVVNAGIACYFETDPHSSAAAEEIFGHELGHTLGLGHSCGDDASGPCSGHAPADDALMRAFVHDDGRGARLTADDRAAIAALYGSGGSTAPDPALPGASGLAVSLDLASSAAVAGEVVTLRAHFAGPAQGARWTIGEDGLALSDTACEPGFFCARYLFPVAGTQSVRVVVADGHGKSAEAVGQLEVKAGPAGSAGAATLGRREALLADAAGPEGARTDLWLFNPSNSPALVEISFQARGIGAVTPRRRVTVDEGRSLHLVDVFALLGAVPGRGSLAVASLPVAGRVEAPAVLALARPVMAPKGVAGATGAAGTTSASAGGYGPLIGGEAQEGWSALPKAIAGILTGTGLSSSLLVASLDPAAGQVRVELLDAAGAVVGAAATVSLGPGVNRLQPLGRLFPAAAGRKGPFTARLTSSGIRFAAAVELAMARSGDRLVLSAVDSGPGGTAGNVWIPRVARGGDAGAPVSGLTVFNGANTARELVIELLPRGVGTKVPPAARRTVAALATLRVDDALRELFGLTQGVGALRVRWSGGQGPAPLVASHALAGAAEPGGPRYGLRVEGFELTDAVVRQGFGFGAEQTTAARSSYGAVNLGESAVTLRLTVHGADGGELASRSLGLAARQHLERDLSGLFPNLGDGDGWSIETEVLAGGPVLPYLLRRDATGDLDVATASETAPAN